MLLLSKEVTSNKIDIAGISKVKLNNSKKTIKNVNRTTYAAEI